MADALVTVAVEKLADLVQRPFVAGSERELQVLISTFESIQAVLHDAEGRQVDDESVRLWLSRLKHVAYDIEDLMDESEISVLERVLERNDDADTENKVFSPCLFSLFSRSGFTMPRLKVGRRVKEITLRLDAIAKEKDIFGFGTSSALIERRRPRTAVVDKSEMMIGRENDREIIISKLVMSGTSPEDDVVAVVGIGGLGKTTLASKIFHDSKIQDHFSMFLWVPASDVSDVEGLTRAILQEVKGEGAFDTEIQAVQNELLEALRGKHFLLVLDDVCNADVESLNMLRLSLECSARRSKILITTRMRKVADVMHAAYIHILQGLSDDYSWTLFSRVAFIGENENPHWSDMVDIGKEIANECEGVPLLIQVMARMMARSQRAVEEWKDILASEAFSKCSEFKDIILPVLQQSYYNLPAHLKKCFVYCSMFQNRRMVKDELVKLWIAQGFIQAEADRDLEDIGSEYFEELVAHSIFQDVRISREETTCKMPHLLQDLAEFFAYDESWIFGNRKSLYCSAGRVRHASIFFTDDELNIPTGLNEAHKLRTLIIKGVTKISKILSDVLSQARFLRALHLGSFKLEELPSTIGELKHLRYLDLSYSSIVELPESVSNLCKLHSLSLNSCMNLRRLPGGMGRLVSLRHLKIDLTPSLESLPEGLGKLGSLRTLSKFIVGGEGGCSMHELQQLNSLEGSLEIQGLGKVTRGEEPQKANLSAKSQIRRLVLDMSASEEIGWMETVLEALGPLHANFEDLELNNYSGRVFPTWIGDSSLSNLTRVGLVSLSHCEHLPGLGKLPALKYLCVNNASVTEVSDEFYCKSDSHSDKALVAFPKLEELIFQDMPNFGRWTSTLGADAYVMPSLLSLELINCPILTVLPDHLANTPLSHMKIEGCDSLIWTACSFTLLEEFTLKNQSIWLPDMPKLKKFHIQGVRSAITMIETLAEGPWEKPMPSEALRTEDFNELESLPSELGLLRALKTLSIHECHMLKSLPYSLGELKNSLMTLSIHDCSRLELLPDICEQFESLQTLSIHECSMLKSLSDNLRQLKSLRSLSIVGCPRLESLPNDLGQLESLETLTIIECPMLMSLPDELGNLQALKSLEIVGLGGLNFLPDGVGQIRSLKHLVICWCEELEALPDGLGQFTQLKFVKIIGCHSLRSLPQRLQQLGLSHPLIIRNCPLLRNE